MTRKRVAIVGGGVCGMGSIFWMKKEGLDPVCFEKTSQVGGTWCYREESTPGVASIMPTTIINHSKEMGAFSEFPPKAECPNYMRHNQFYQYMMDFVNREELLKHVKVNSEVTGVRRSEDYEVTGRWEVTVRDVVTGVVTSEIYDGVTICVGFFNRPKMPSYPDQEIFKGKVIHTHSLKTVDGYRGQNVVVVGMGCSGLDAAVEMSSVAKQVYLSTRSGGWVINRVGPYGYPIDRILMRRWQLTLLYYLPWKFISSYLEKVYLNPYFDYDLYNVKPEQHVLSRDPILNDHIHSKLISGSVLQKRAIDRFTEHGVVFQGDDNVTAVDSVIMATGYSWKFPFLEHGVLEVAEDGMVKLYKCMFPPQLPHATLAFLGFVLPFGPGFPIGEMQCRLAARMMAGHTTLPSEDVMMRDIVARHRRNSNRYPVDDKTSIRVDYLEYMDELSALVGCKPNLWRIFVTDIRLFWKMVFGPVVSYQYRLEGPHKWDGAREAIMTCDDRIITPLTSSRADLKSERTK